MREIHEEHQHRFSLQVAENKRLLVHLNAQKAEMQALQVRPRAQGTRRINLSTPHLC